MDPKICIPVCFCGIERSSTNTLRADYYAMSPKISVGLPPKRILASSATSKRSEEDGVESSYHRVIPIHTPFLSCPLSSWLCHLSTKVVLPTVNLSLVSLPSLSKKLLNVWSFFDENLYYWDIKGNGGETLKEMLEVIINVFIELIGKVHINWKNNQSYFSVNWVNRDYIADPFKSKSHYLSQYFFLLLLCIEFEVMSSKIPLLFWSGIYWLSFIFEFSQSLALLKFCSGPLPELLPYEENSNGPAFLLRGLMVWNNRAF